MAKRTKKVGAAGKYGARYGVRVRKRLKKIESDKSKRYPCPRCNHESVKRRGTGIWKCGRCKLVFAGGAFRPFVSPSFRREAVTSPQLVEEEPEEESENV
ncbi:MAG: 50S ribosomal protein L37Ae [Thermoplasmata archaeon]|nr:50S ribosomal protein L37Ae [Thermoplasmata archaeon]